MNAPTRRSTAAAATACTLALACALAGPRAAAQTLPDPTVPPAAARPGAAAGAAPLPSGPQLQSVLLGNHGRQVAVIDGRSLQAGDTIHGATLVKVGQDHVVLQRGRAQQILKLFPVARTGAPLPHASPAPVNSANK